MNSINAKSVQLIELHAFAYYLLSVSLSESFDLRKDNIYKMISRIFDRRIMPSNQINRQTHQKEDSHLLPLPTSY